ncbi:MULTISPECIES: CaiB/BaiF CoA-transferase family protein [unclassified Acidovorax]|uniref:CaiB/BaiF CoA transferase family protein n=2 Tax=Acidovorax TaxID=12916 RepID=UPI000BD622DC|nr:MULTISPECIES: CaiB/BaiF CoA-transferase family protein [unclassified Acidovorax]HQS22594.1 CaiB/BaiF CoA-transferase family protein [Acidovorax defluvii]OYY28934.1 MAG: formyl-CoA transferase [Acidovorax sp. 35-64-16]OYZ46210.1 MAG: formyl-CoA transferase [Acidovorax sp. 16-64-162]OYZ66190.1 MAG: formyl-CoA transferase [Acidovorax sp. 24-64-9]OZA71220.1 MAG: formyl-CoA transferase [Acidovorax sp. 39-64-12]
MTSAPSSPAAPASSSTPGTASRPLPLAGLRVVEFTHMVMGPTCGMVLADLGAEVIKVEPVEGDRTRHLLGAGAGFFPMFNRNKKSIALDLRRPEGLEVARKLAASADVVAQNFKPGVMTKYGLDYAALSQLNPRLIYVNHTGFLPGPYEHRTALDEVVQMMGGLAYMTGRPGDPLRAGTSVNDIMGGMFGAIGAMAALMQRGITGRGQEVDSALFENNVFLVGQHMMQYAVTGQPAAPMPERISSWALYDVFSVKDGEQIFLAAVSDAQWITFCDALGFADLKADPQLATNNDRVRQRATMLPELRQRLAAYSAAELTVIFEKNGLPFAPILRPDQLFDDPHLNATGGLADITLPDGERAGQTARTTLFPLRMDGQRLGVRLQPPVLGQHTVELMEELGYTGEQVQALRAQGAVA